MTALTRETSKMLVALNADVVGYSRLMADDLEVTTSVMGEYHRLVEREVEASEGSLVAFVGDNFMAVFDDVTAAMRAAIAISSEVEARNADVPHHRRVRFRMGIDRGEVAISEDGQYFGEALNIAARIQAIAQPGGLSISGEVYKALDEPELRFKAAGPRSFKNIPGTVPVYEFLDLPVEGHTKPRHPTLDSPTVAVLPIHTEKVDDELRSIADLLMAGVVHRLASIPRLGVVDATGSTGEENGATVQYMLESGIHQFRDNIRVYSKLVDVATINVVFSHRWDATLDDVIGLSDRMPDDIARSLEVELIVGEPARIYAELADPASQEHIYKGWFELTAGTAEGWRRAIEHFGEVVEMHPDVTTGYALLAFAHWVGASDRFADDQRASFRKATEYARRGIETGDPTGLSQMVEAASLLSEGQIEEALERLEGVEITRPTCDVTYALEGSVRRYLGQWQRSLELIDRAMRLTQVTNPWYPTVQACALYIGDRFEDAASTAEAVLDHQPNNLEALLVLAAAQNHMGLDRRAAATAASIRDRYPAVDIGQWLGSNPYQDPTVVERWRQDLRALGLVG
ncbi:MAG TPA: adenylate/guanylate cyclase domain-containing protein [Acidimicrobiia bacterium]|jgi:adenylate cyclase